MSSTPLPPTLEEENRRVGRRNVPLLPLVPGAIRSLVSRGVLHVTSSIPGHAASKLELASDVAVRATLYEIAPRETRLRVLPRPDILHLLVTGVEVQAEVVLGAEDRDLLHHQLEQMKG